MKIKEISVYLGYMYQALGMALENTMVHTSMQADFKFLAGTVSNIAIRESFQQMFVIDTYSTLKCSSVCFVSLVESIA